MEALEIVTNGTIITFEPMTNMNVRDINTSQYPVEMACASELWDTVLEKQTSTTAELIDQLTTVKNFADTIAMTDISADLWMLCDTLQDLLRTDVNAHSVRKTVADVLQTQYVIKTMYACDGDNGDYFTGDENRCRMFTPQFGKAQTFETIDEAECALKAFNAKTHNEFTVGVTTKPVPTW